MEIQVGEYVRTEKGYIGKIIEFDKSVDCYTVEDNEHNYWVEPIFIVKHSFNIIDLIEVKDVIEFKELATDEKYGTIVNQTYILDIHDNDELNFIKEEIDRNAIKILSIVTKETFESIKYEV